MCQQAKPKQQNEPLTSHDDGNGPWRNVGVDLFELDRVDYLLTVDYFSGFFEIDKMTTTTVSQVINKLKPHFARYGIPRQLVSDNGPQFSSREFEKFAHLWKFLAQDIIADVPKIQRKGRSGCEVGKEYTAQDDWVWR